MEAAVNGAAALVLAFLGDEFAPPAMLGTAVGCVVAGAVARGLTDHVSRRYLRTKPVSVDLPAGWEWVTPCVQVGLVLLITWHFGATVGMVAAAVVAGAAIPAIDAVRKRWQVLTRLVGWGR